uniref:Putative secreted protein n=1 Tax=Anopheles darlingi TaxID=43151 RepID=A0A2M4D3A1_ANODA
MDTTRTGTRSAGSFCALLSSLWHLPCCCCCCWPPLDESLFINAVQFIFNVRFISDTQMQCHRFPKNSRLASSW